MAFPFSLGPVLTGTATAVGTVPVAGYEIMDADIDLSASTETINVTGSVDGTNFNAAKLRPIDLSTAAAFASGDVKDGLFQYNIKGLSQVKFTKSSTSESVTIRIGLL